MANGAEPAGDTGTNGGGGNDSMDDIRSSLANALERSRETSTPEERTPVPASTPESETGQPVERDRPASPQDQPDQEDARSETKPLSEDGRQRDEHGRFLPKTGDQAPTKDVPTGPENQEEARKDQTPAKEEAARLAPPPGWSPTSKAEFAKLPPSVQQDVAKREAEVNAGLVQLRDYRRLQQELEPIAQFANSHGVTIRETFDRYRRAEENLVNRPIDTLLAFCRHANVHPVQLAQIAQQRAGGPVPQFDQPGLPEQHQQGAPLPNQGHPAPQPSYYQPQNYTASQQNQPRPLTAEQVREITLRTQEEQRMQSDVQQFFNDPSYPFAENVRSAMAVLIKAGQADNLSDAYEKAVWANPETRQLLIKQEREAEEARKAAEAREAASKARQAGKSISGSPLPGGASARPPKADLDLHEHLAANLKALRSSV